MNRQSLTDSLTDIFALKGHKPLKASIWMAFGHVCTDCLYLREGEAVWFLRCITPGSPWGALEEWEPPIDSLHVLLADMEDFYGNEGPYASLLWGHCGTVRVSGENAPVAVVALLEARTAAATIKKNERKRGKRRRPGAPAQDDTLAA